MGAWHYQDKPVEGGTRNIVEVASVLPLAVGTLELKPARLRFTDDPVWGYECALELGSGDFHCPVGCRVSWLVDDREALEVAASRPDADPPRLSLDEARHRWFELRDARLLTVQFKGKDHRLHKAMFDVADLDRGRLDWDRQRYAELYWQEHENALRAAAKP